MAAEVEKYEDVNAARKPLIFVKHVRFARRSEKSGREEDSQLALRVNVEPW